ncbi:LysR family transcriptional regulator [Mycoavidus sp. B2-EB]|uniref:LysR family transcriptional regulator n=1 Tax=Mycoavidus sp. B2-EB TaxID=2651972 RepID=UPI00162AB56C|nr:LysR family transcriptional regulator [Mycoavidus sp. B2-EB]BBO59288.1 LysR family transcriptional regulator [Mycoavidus sp. B2-EB]
MIINQKRLGYFYAVYTHRKICKAADHLDIDSSIITRQIKLLEKEIGHKLFERRPHIVLTEAGEFLLKYYHVNRSLQADLEVCLQESINMWRGTIQIATSPIFIDTLMDDVIKEFYYQYPKLQINIQEVKASSQVVTQILEDEAHIGMMTHHSPQNPDVHYCARALLPIHLLISKSHPLAEKQSVTFAEATRYPLAMPPTSFSLWEMVRLAEQSEKIQLTPTFTSDSVYARKKFASSNDGGALMSALAAHHEINTGQLIALKIEHPAFMSSEFCLIIRQGKPLSSAVHQLLRLLSSKLSIFAQSLESNKKDL